IGNNKKRKQTEFLLPKLTLLSLAIDLKYRGKGIGTELLMFSENNLLDNNIDNSYYLSVLKSNVNGINFYKKMNFKMLGENNSLCYMLKDIYRRKDCE
ncbi:TPA: GNAT family N-acetyltransferase, partial [Enterococcus faecium]